jgi:tetratricopeptide (TPR) repeat protein
MPTTGGWMAALCLLFATGIAAAGPLADRYLGLAEARMQEKNYLGAAFLYERILSEDSTRVEVLYRLGEAYREMGRTSYQIYFKKSIDAYNRLERVVGSEDRRFREALAELYTAQWDMESAVSTYEGLLGEYPEDCGLWIRLADAERLKGAVLRSTEGMAAEEEQLVKAEDLYNRIIERCPDRLEPYDGLAIIQNMYRQYAKTSAMYAGLIAKHPGNMNLVRGKAIADFAARDWEMAAVGFKELLEKDPREEERLQYISCLLKLGKKDEAEEQERIYKSKQVFPYGPDPLLPIDVLRRDLGIQASVEKAVALAEANQFDAALAELHAAQDRVAPQLEAEDPAMRDAAAELSGWIGARITYFEKRKAQAAP